MKSVLNSCAIMNLSLIKEVIIMNNIIDLTKPVAEVVKEHPEIKAAASQIPWQLDDDFKEMLPIMQTDIMLSSGGKTLIIDAKYYEHSLQKQYDSYSVHSGNLYQIFTYVKNKEMELKNQDHESVSGMLLYAKTDEVVYPDHEYKMSGNTIAVRTLDLDKNFTEIKKQLDVIVEKYLQY